MSGLRRDSVVLDGFKVMYPHPDVEVGVHRILGVEFVCLPPPGRLAPFSEWKDAPLRNLTKSLFFIGKKR